MTNSDLFRESARIINSMKEIENLIYTIRSNLGLVAEATSSRELYELIELMLETLQIFISKPHRRDPNVNPAIILKQDEQWFRESGSKTLRMIKKKGQSPLVYETDALGTNPHLKVVRRSFNLVQDIPEEQKGLSELRLLFAHLKRNRNLPKIGKNISASEKENNVRDQLKRQAGYFIRKRRS